MAANALAMGAAPVPASLPWSSLCSSSAASGDASADPRRFSSSIWSLREAGFGANKRLDVRLYYGSRNVQRMAYQTLRDEGVGYAMTISMCTCQNFETKHWSKDHHATWSASIARSKKTSLLGRVFARRGRSVMYEDVDNYVLLEPGEEERFVNQEELQAKLKACLTKLSETELPEDLARFNTLDEAVAYLIDSACELDLGGGSGSIQWFEVRLESQ